MILWIILFILVVAISFVLAAQSMRDFAENPSDDRQYSLFLIRNTPALTTAFLNSIQSDLKQSASFISFERLIKGAKSALVVYAPKNVILKYQDVLNLLELEDYTHVKLENISAWGVGIKNPSLLKIEQKIFENLPQMSGSEQFWWQIVLSSSFQPQITAVVVSEDLARKKYLAATLHNLAPQNLTKLPKAYSNNQMLEFYQKRSFRKDNKHQNLTSEQIVQSLLI